MRWFGGSASGGVVAPDIETRVADAIKAGLAEGLAALPGRIADEFKPRHIITPIPDHLDSKQIVRLREAIEHLVNTVALEAAKRNS